MVERFQRAALNLPEDLKDDLRRAGEFYRSDAWKSYWSAAKAAMDGDEAPLRQWAY
jgi:hypothetical protein